MASQSEAIRITLQSIRDAIRQQALEQTVAPSGKFMGDPRQALFWNKLARYETRLRTILARLTSDLNRYQGERTLLWRIPREHRYSARQSLEDREAATLDLVELAERTLQDLLDFGGSASGMKPADWENLAEKATETAVNIDKTLTQTVVQQLQKGPAFTAANPHPGLGLEHLPALVGMIVAIIAARRRKT